jgi:hypothetical protein
MVEGDTLIEAATSSPPPVELSPENLREGITAVEDTVANYVWSLLTREEEEGETPSSSKKEEEEEKKAEVVIVEDKHEVEAHLKVLRARLKREGKTELPPETPSQYAFQLMVKLSVLSQDDWQAQITATVKDLPDLQELRRSLFYGGHAQTMLYVGYTTEYLPVELSLDTAAAAAPAPSSPEEEEDDQLIVFCFYCSYCRV